MSHGHHHNASDAGHNQNIAQAVQASVQTKSAKDDDAAAKLAAKEAKNAEKEAARVKAQEERDAKKATKQAEREAANAKKEEERVAKAAEREAEKAAKAAERQKARDAEKEAKKAEREAAKEASKEATTAAKEAKKAEAQAAKEAAKEARKAEVARRAQLVEDRKAQTKIDGERRSKATHIVLNAEGFSNPQSTSIRGKVLEHLRANYVAGEKIAIEQLAKETKPLLYGASVRSFLSKLEERGHLDFVTEVAADDAPEDSKQGE